MFEGIKRAHLVGAGGIGLSAVGKWLCAMGVEVSGSDAVESEVTRSLQRIGVQVTIGHEAKNVPYGINIVIYSDAVQATNPERLRAKELGIRQQSYFEFLGEVSRKFSTIVVTGTNGKSTTTAMVGRILEDAGYDPTVIVGSLVPGWTHGNLRIGKGRFFVVEGCEYREHMNLLVPEMAVITNIEADHLDYYRDIDHIRCAFQTFVDKLKGKGFCVRNADDPQSRRLVIDRGISFGTGEADYQATERRVEAGVQRFLVVRAGETLGEITLGIPGTFNVMNALAATTAAMELGVPFATCAQTLKDFPGIWRRFERVGKFNGADVLSDYGHHPTAMAGTLAATKEFFPGRRILLCFQPHQHSRTLELKDEFIEALSLADHAIIPEIYGVLGRTEQEAELISSRDLVAGVKAKQPEADIAYAPDLAEAERMLREEVKKDDVILVMGAGDVDIVARKLTV